ncbi:GNAT family N-acetyltransferase [Microbulbifer magnicolonia]|uniref:GNAT family N-acetyltransferase n=1 Tax=Microbulbifer magnicolonia TaxID=3109744 RepID=UPI002B4151E7|nr:GNAT family N-acetyltransferase [Microbulbifer sp. GG15]
MSVIRAARLSDAKNLAELAEVTFRDTFSEQNTPENMDAHCQSSYAEEIQAREISNPEYATIVAETDDKLVAYAQLRWGNPPGCVSANYPGEIQRLYVDKDFHGKGLAHELMSECLNILNERHADIAWLGVWENNPRAIAFYKKFNFQEVGDHIFSLGSDPQRDIILVRPV